MHNMPHRRAGKQPVNIDLRFFYFFTLFMFCGAPASGQTSLPKYDMKFQIRDEGGRTKDTVIPEILFPYWSRSASFPGYVKWNNLPFALKRGSDNKPYLHTDSASRFAPGDTVGFAFVKFANSGMPEFNYMRTNIADYLAHSKEPNLRAVMTDRGVALIATQRISPDTELTLNYAQLAGLLPNHPGALKMKSW